jgi:hypothetical protein
MKLYTEEQVREVIMSIDTSIYITDSYIDSKIEQLKPIELPSDEEIEARARGFTDYPYGQAGFIRGCQWVIEQIKQHGNE